MKKIKLPVLFLVLAVSAFVFWRYLNSYLEKPKAAADRAVITYNPVSLEIPPGGEASFSALLAAENQKKISAVDLSFKFGDTLEYISYNVIPQGYFDDKVMESTASAAGETTLRIVSTAQKPESELVSSLLINIGVRAKNKTGTTVFRLDTAASQIVGPVAGGKFEVVETLPLNIGIGEAAPQITGPTNPVASPTAAADQPAGSGSANLSLMIRFQGIRETPQTTSLPVKVIIKRQQQLIDEKIIDFRYDAGASSEAKGRWLGSGSFNAASGSGYTVFIKGPKHIQKKICNADPAEALGAEGTYHCTVPSLTIGSASSFDFSKILLLAGDLPVQDGVVNSYDISLVRNNLGKSDAEAVQKADINLDGKVDTQDYSLIIAALSIRTDEE